MTTEKDKARVCATCGKLENEFCSNSFHLSNDKTAEEIERIKKAEAYADSIDRRGTSYWVGLSKGYIDGPAQQLKEYKDVIRELLPLAEEGYKFSKRGVSHQEFLSDDRELIDRARKLIDQTDSTK